MTLAGLTRDERAVDVPARGFDWILVGAEMCGASVVKRRPVLRPITELSGL